MPGYRPRIDQLLHQVEDRAHHLQAERSDQMIMLGGNRHHFVRAEGFPVHNQRLHDLGLGFPLGAIQNGLLFIG